MQGFTTWPTRVSFPDFNFTYQYSIGNSQYKGDVVGDFVRDARARGIRVGFYYSVVSNAYLRVQNGQVVPSAPLGPTQANVTQEQYERIVVAQLSELWGNYGDLEEIWTLILAISSSYLAGLMADTSSRSKPI